jgi:methylmalonyl-CoA mutase cobalamin-binding subunit
MAKGKGFELIPQSVPPRRMSSSSFYRQIVNEFLKSDAKSVLVSGTDRKPATLVQSLRKVLETDGVSDVSVVQRSNDVYITRK